MDVRRLGRAFRAVRIRLHLRQRDLAEQCGVSQSVISRVERGIAEVMSLADLRRIADSLNIRLSIDAWWRGGDLNRLLDADHATIVDYIVGRLRSARWEVLVEYGFNHYGERGSVDIVAWHPRLRALLLVEVKSRFFDLQEMLATFARKLRIVPPLLAEARGWRPEFVGTLIVAPGTTANRRVVADHPNIFEASYPSRSRDAQHWVREPSGPFAGLWFVSPNVLTARGSGGPRRVRHPAPRPAS
jgi:transcriptional regulator with XRE-family HTH domain